MITAAELLAAYDQGQQVPLLTTASALDLDGAYAVSSEIAALRMARGERPVGRKIGFTNRTIWPIYNVDAPVWSYVWNTSLHDIPASGEVTLPPLAELRLEPEIIFGFKAAPSAEMSLNELWHTIDWISHGVELVTSAFEGWRFTAPDAAATQAMHASLWTGPRIAASELNIAALETFTLQLEGPDTQLAGHARDVLGGPLHALQHLLREIPHMPNASPITAGEVVTTGTLTDAVPVTAGERWRTTLNGCPLPGLDLILRAPSA